MKDQRTLINNTLAGNPIVQSPVHRDQVADVRAFLEALLHRDERTVSMLQLWAAGRP